MIFRLPEEITLLLDARNRLRRRFQALGRTFTFDGNLIGDLGEAVAAELFDIELIPPQQEGVDARALLNARKISVQIKATGTGRGPSFRYIRNRADHLLFLDMDFERCEVEVVFNGPEALALAKLPSEWKDQRSLSPAQIRAADREVRDEDRLLPRQSPLR